MREKLPPMIKTLVQQGNETALMCISIFSFVFLLQSVAPWEGGVRRQQNESHCKRFSSFVCAPRNGRKGIPYDTNIGVARK